MRAEDAQAISAILFRNEILVDGVTLLSPSDEERRIAKLRWPGAELREFGRDQWNLDGMGPLPAGDWGIAIAANTFMCASDPAHWIRNIARTHRYLLIQDLSITQRQPHRHLSPETGDVARYSLSSHAIVGITDEGYPVHDISSFGHEIVDCVSYGFDDGRGVKFVVLLRLQP